MSPDNIQFGGGVAESIVNPAVLLAVLLVGVLIMVLPRGRAIAPFLAAGILIPMDQIVVVAGLHFPMLRVLALFGFMRMIWARTVLGEPIFSGGINGIDVAVMVLTVFRAIDGVLLWQVTGEAIYQLGVVWTTFGVYFLVRYLIRDEEDVRRAIRVLAYVTIVIAAFMAYERATGRNLIYATLGGANAFMGGAGERGDHFRAAGPFGHAILAGSFGGFMFPLFVARWRKTKESRKLATAGAVAAIVIPFLTGTSTSLFALLAGIGALLLWRLRRSMQVLRWSVVAIVVMLHIVMKAPVWHLIARVSLSDGSSSYHRFMLVDECIRHFWDWALIGAKDYASWGWDMWDLCNQYVAMADTAGLIPLIAFVAILVYGFKYLGKARRYYETDRVQERFIWAIGAVLFANAVAFMGVSYFDQTIVPWYAVLAMISVVTLAARTAEKSARAEEGGLGLSAVPAVGLEHGAAALELASMAHVESEGFGSR